MCSCCEGGSADRVAIRKSVCLHPERMFEGRFSSLLLTEQQCSRSGWSRDCAGNARPGTVFPCFSQRFAFGVAGMATHQQRAGMILLFCARQSCQTCRKKIKKSGCSQVFGGTRNFCRLQTLVKSNESNVSSSPLRCHWHTGYATSSIRNSSSAGQVRPLLRDRRYPSDRNPAAIHPSAALLRSTVGPPGRSESGSVLSTPSSQEKEGDSKIPEAEARAAETATERGST